jgi:ABC-type enterobactin transport system permease subunit
MGNTPEQRDVVLALRVMVFVALTAGGSLGTSGAAWASTIELPIT